MNRYTAAVCIAAMAAVSIMAVAGCATGHDGALLTGAISAVVALPTAIVAREVGVKQGEIKAQNKILTRKDL